MEINLDSGRATPLFTLIQITEQIKNSIEKGKIGCGVFVDLKKPFNTVNLLWKT